MNKRIYLLLVFLSAIPLSLSAKDLVGARYPSLSPDGTKIAFSYMGDIWIAGREGGRALRITDHAAYDYRPHWSPDGTQIVFTSNRSGNNDLYLISSGGGDPVQLTFHSSNDEATGWSPDGKRVLFQSNRSSSSSIFSIPAAGGNPAPLLDTYWSWPYDATLSPDGKTLVFASGMENRFHWRKGYRGANSAKIIALSLADLSSRELVSDPSNSFWPCWSRDGASVYFLSDRNGTYNIWKVDAAGGDETRVTGFREGDARYLSLASAAPWAVYERNFGIWITDLTGGRSKPVPLEAPSERKENTRRFLKNEPVSEYAVSPDGKKIAAVVRGDIFILGNDGGYARNITESPWKESSVIWDRESRRVIYIADDNALPNLYSRDALGLEKPKQLTATETDVLNPRLSPDGAYILYASGPREYRLIKPDGSGDRLLAEGNFGGRFGDDASWSPDSRYVAMVEVVNGQRDIFAVSVDDGSRVKLTDTAYDESNPVWSPNGKFMLFTSNRSGHSFPEFTGKWDIYQLHFAPETPEFKEDEFEALFKTDEKQSAEKKERKKDDPAGEKGDTALVTFRLDNIDLQTVRVTNTLGDDRSFILSPRDTATVYFVTNIDGKSHFWETTLKKKGRGQYKPFVPDVTSPSSLSLDPKGKAIYYLSSGRIGRIDLAGKKSESVSFTTSIEVDRTDDYRQALGELYYTLEYYYYDPGHHNADWKALYEKYMPVLEQVRCDEDFCEYANQLIGHLNSSHTGISGPGGGFRTEEPTGHCGVIWKTGSAVQVERLLRDGPLWMHRDSVRAGDRLLSINGSEVDPAVNIWKQFNGTLNKRLTLVFKSVSLDRNVSVPVEAISSGAESELVREEWIRSNRAAVKKMTGDRVAYIYMSAMGGGDLERFLKELERDAVPREGLILDLRYNMGGNVHDRVLNALVKPVYGKWRVRGMEESTQSTFGFAGKPVVLITNEVTLSDGEMTTAGFKALKRGPVVGNTTYGWLIFTTGARLMNGGYFRLPFWGCYSLDGTDLETHGGCRPDIMVINTLNDDLQGSDPQLDKAVEVILSKL